MAKLKDVIAELKSLDKKLKATWDGDQSTGLCRRRLCVEDDGRVCGYLADPNCDGEVDYGTFTVVVAGVKFKKEADENLCDHWHSEETFEDAHDADFGKLKEEAIELLDTKVIARSPDFESFTDYQWSDDDIEIAVCGVCCDRDFQTFAKNDAGDVFAFEEELEELPEGLEFIDDCDAVNLLSEKNLDWDLD